MTFGEVVHYVPHHNAWPEQVCAIASLLLPLHSADPPKWRASNPLASNNAPAAPAQSSYTATDFQHLIDSIAAGLNVLVKPPHYGGTRSTVPLWSQVLHALARTLSSEVLILEDTPFILPRAQDAASQPSDVIDGHATLIVAHAICSTTRSLSDRSNTSSGSREQDHEMIYSVNSSPRGHFDESSSRTGSSECKDALKYPGDYNSRHGSLDSLDGIDIPLEAHMLPGRWKWQYCVLPVLLVADSCNIVSLICSTLYQRHVWGICEPVVGLCCSNTGTIATTIFGWLDSDKVDENCMPVPHLALAAVDHLDPLMGVFNFADSCSAITLAQFVLRLRGHFQDIKGVASIETVNSLTPFHWRSDLPGFRTQIEGKSEDRVASWINEVHVQTSSSEASSSVVPRTPSPLPDPAVSLSSEKMSLQDLDSIPEEGESGAKSSAPQLRVRKSDGVPRPRSSKRKTESVRSSLSQESARTEERSTSRYSNSEFAALSDNGQVETPSMSNWLFERKAFILGRIEMPSDNPEAVESDIHKMMKIYDDMTGSTWSDAVQRTLSVSTIDTSVSNVRDTLFERYKNSDDPFPINMPKEDVEFISARLSALLHAVQGAGGCQSVAHLHGANEAERRHEWDALLIQFFQPVSGRRDVLLERTLNSARNLAVDDDSFAEHAVPLAAFHADFCYAQWRSLFRNDVSQRDSLDLAVTARNFATDFTDDITRRNKASFIRDIAKHSKLDPSKGISDAVLVISIPGATTAMLKRIQGKAAQDQFLKSFTLVHGKPDKQDSSPPEDRYRHSPQSDPTRQLQPPPPSHSSARQRRKERKEQIAKLQNLFLIHPDRKEGASQPLEEPLPEVSEQDLLLPVLLCEYKKKNESAMVKATNQMRMYLVSSLRFLGAFGIGEQPVFGLVANGCRGGIVMGWQKNGKIYILERNIRHYDITKPLDAFQFASVLLRLSRHGLELRARFDATKDAFYASLDTSTYTRWSKLSQIPEDEQRLGSEAA